MKTSINKIFFSLFVLTFLLSCENRGYADYEPGATPTVALNGEWYVDIIDEASGDVLGQHFLHKTFDNNEGKMFIDDLQNGYYIKGLVDVNTSNLTFSTTDEENQNDPGTTFTITEGKIMKNVAQSRNGNVVDSIYFKGEFSYDPGTIIIFSGHKRTGFLEDEY